MLLPCYPQAAVALEGAAYHHLPSVFSHPHAAGKREELGYIYMYAQVCSCFSMFCSVDLSFLLVDNQLWNVELGRRGPRVPSVSCQCDRRVPFLAYDSTRTP